MTRTLLRTVGTPTLALELPTRADAAAPIPGGSDAGPEPGVRDTPSDRR